MKWLWGWVRAGRKKQREPSDEPSHRPSTEAGSLTFETLEPRVLLSVTPLDVPNVPADTTAPTITASLLHDTGTSATDRLTNDPSVAGTVKDEAGGSGLAKLS